MREQILAKLSHKATQLHNQLKPTEPWNIDVSSLQNYPAESLGFALYEFYKENQFHPISGMEYHDADHLILQLKTDVKSEVYLQFFLLGNGKKTFFCLLACMSSLMLLPEIWFNCLLAYKKGKSFKPIWHINLKNELNNPLAVVRNKVLQPLYLGNITHDLPVGTFYQKIF